MLCIGVGFADTILGPYQDIGAPLIRDDLVGVIDPSVYYDDISGYYLLWKDDGNGAEPKLPS